MSVIELQELYANSQQVAAGIQSLLETALTEGRAVAASPAPAGDSESGEGVGDAEDELTVGRMSNAAMLASSILATHGAAEVAHTLLMTYFGVPVLLFCILRSLILRSCALPAVNLCCLLLLLLVLLCNSMTDQVWTSHLPASGLDDEKQMSCGTQSTCMCPVMHCMIGHNAGPVPSLRAISGCGKCSMLFTANVWCYCQQISLHDC